MDGTLLGIGQLICGTVFAFFYWLVLDPRLFASVTFSAPLVTSVVLTAAICTAFAFTAQSYVLQYVSPTRLVVILGMQPVFTMILEQFFKGPGGAPEPLSVMKAIGGLMVILGTVVSEIGLVEQLRARMEAQREEEPSQ